MAKLKALPANTWIDRKADPKPPSKGCTRAACDPIRGYVHFFGGGHGDYQINDVQIYALGANQWAFAAGDNNDCVPPSAWDASGRRRLPPHIPFRGWQGNPSPGPHLRWYDPTIDNLDCEQGML